MRAVVKLSGVWGWLTALYICMYMYIFDEKWFTWVLYHHNTIDDRWLSWTARIDLEFSRRLGWLENAEFTVQEFLLLSLFALVPWPHPSKQSSKPWLTGFSYPLQELAHGMKSSKKLTRTNNDYKDQLVGGSRKFMSLREGGTEMPHEAGWTKKEKKKKKKQKKKNKKISTFRAISVLRLLSWPAV